MGNVDWGCLAVQVAITGVAFYLVNMLILFKDVDGKAPSIKRDDMNLFLSLLLAILVGYWATTYVKPDCVSVPYTRQEGKENWNPFNGGDWANLGGQIQSGWNSNLNPVRDIGNFAGNQIASGAQDLGGQIASGAQGAWNDVSRGAQSAANSVGHAFSSMYR